MKTKFKETTRLALVALVVMLSVTLTQAQPGGQKGGQQGPPPLPTDEQIEKMVTDLSAELDLSETQEKQVSELYFAHFEEVEAVTGNSNSRPDREVMDQMKKDFETDVKSVLTKDQQKQYESYMKKQQSQKRGQGKPRQ